MEVILKSDGTVEGTHLIINGEDVTKKIPIASFTIGIGRVPDKEIYVHIEEVIDSRETKDVSNRKGCVSLSSKCLNNNGDVIDFPNGSLSNLGNYYPPLVGRKENA